MIVLNTITETKNKCAHCGAIIDQNNLYDEQIGKYFCCNGCKTVYDVINQEGFASYYEKRIDFESGLPVEITETSGDYFEPYIKKQNNGLLELVFLISGIRWQLTGVYRIGKTGIF